MRVAKRATFILVAFLLTFLVGGEVFSQGPSPGSVAAQTAANCQEIIDKLKAEGDPRLGLLNPVLTSQSEVEERIRFYKDALDCMDEIEASDIHYGPLKPAIDLFLSLTDSSDHKIEFVDLAKSKDKAVKKLRDEVGIPAPKGFVFVNYFQSRDDLPECLATSSLGIFAEGVTVPCRFIVVLEESGWTQGQKQLHKQDLPSTISHELVHAYLRATLGAEDPLPHWFHEGAAVYFGGSGLSILFTADGIVSSRLPEEYEDYGRVFRYLREQLGEEGFNNLIRSTIETKSEGGIYSATGTRSFASLSQKVILWEKEEQEKRSEVTWWGVFLVIAIGCVAILGVVAVLNRLNTR